MKNSEKNFVIVDNRKLYKYRIDKIHRALFHYQYQSTYSYFEGPNNKLINFFPKIVHFAYLNLN